MNSESNEGGGDGLSLRMPSSLPLAARLLKQHGYAGTAESRKDTPPHGLTTRLYFFKVGSYIATATKTRISRVPPESSSSPRAHCRICVPYTATPTAISRILSIGQFFPSTKPLTFHMSVPALDRFRFHSVFLLATYRRSTWNRHRGRPLRFPLGRMMLACVHRHSIYRRGGQHRSTFLS